MTPEQEALAESVRAAISRHADADDLWERLVQIGAPELELPEALVVLEELGYALTTTPLLSTVLATAALHAVGGHGDLLDRIAGGAVATVLTDALSGKPGQALEGDRADLVLAVTEDGLVEVDPSTARRTWTPTLDATLRLATVELGSTTVLSPDGTAALAAVARAGTLGVVALQVGTARRALDMTVGYSKERVQFGRPIGSFQALKHRMADMLVLVEMSRSALAAAVDDDTMLPAASTYCSDALDRVAAETVQLHGGIAMTWEHDAHLVLKRAHSLGHLFGTAREHRSRIPLT